MKLVKGWLHRNDRYKVDEVQWDYTEPIAWAVWDDREKAYCGRVWYKSRQSAVAVTRMLNEEVSSC